MLTEGQMKKDIHSNSEFVKAAKELIDICCYV